MRKRLSLSMLILAILVMGSILPASAQSSVDPTLLSFVQAAFNSTLAVNSLSVDVDSTTATTGTGPGGFGVERTASYQLASNASDDWNVTGKTSTIPSVSNATPDANSTPQDNTTTEEIAIVDGKTYIRFTQIPQRMQQQNPPSTWVDASTLPQPAQGGGFGGGFAASAPTAAQILEALSLPIDATSISGLTEQAADTIGGQAVRVFQITLNVDALLKNADAAGLLNAGFGRGGGFGGGRGGFGGRNGGNGANGGAQATPPVNAPAATVEAPSSANTQVTLTVSIGADNFVYRIVSVVTRTGMGQDGTGSISLTSTTNFANFNQPVTISAPTIGS